MRSPLRLCLLALTLYFFIPQTLANEIPPFDYSKTWRIIYFQGDSQFVNQRPQDYNPAQGFIVIFELLNKYVTNMHPFGAEASDEMVKSLGIWAQLYLINDVTYQELLLGDHILSDGKGWVVMNDEDYKNLSHFLIERKSQKGDPFEGNKEQALKKLLWQDNGQDPIESFDAQYHSSSQTATKDSSGSNKPPVNIPSEPESHRQSSASTETREPTSDTLANKIIARPGDRAEFSTSKHNNSEPGQAKNSQAGADNTQNSSKFIFIGLIIVVVSFLTLFHRRKNNR